MSARSRHLIVLLIRFPRTPLQIPLFCLIIPTVAKVMDLENALRAGRFLDDISLSVKKIIFANFPHLSAEERKDIDQEVKLKLWKMAYNGKNIRNIRSYLWRMVYTTALDVIGQRLNGMSFGDHDNGENVLLSERLDLGSPEQLMEKSELKSMVERAVESLPEKRRLVVKLHLTGMGIEETAEFLAWSENKVRHLLYRGLADLKRAFGEQQRTKRGTGTQSPAFKRRLALKESDE